MGPKVHTFIKSINRMIILMHIDKKGNHLSPGWKWETPAIQKLSLLFGLTPSYYKANDLKYILYRNRYTFFRQSLFLGHWGTSKPVIYSLVYPLLWSASHAREDPGTAVLFFFLSSYNSIISVTLNLFLYMYLLLGFMPQPIHHFYLAVPAKHFYGLVLMFPEVLCCEDCSWCCWEMDSCQFGGRVCMWSGKCVHIPSCAFPGSVIDPSTLR